MAKTLTSVQNGAYPYKIIKGRETNPYVINSKILPCLRALNILALPWKRGFGDVITNIRDTSLSIFTNKERRASDTKNHHLAVRQLGALTVTKCTGMPTDKNDDCICNELKDTTFADIIKYIRDEKKLGEFHHYGPIRHSKDGGVKLQYIECSKRKRDGCQSPGRIKWTLYQDGKTRLKLSFIPRTSVRPTMSVDQGFHSRKM